MEQFLALIIGGAVSWSSVGSRCVDFLGKCVDSLTAILTGIPDWDGKHTHAHGLFLELSVASNVALASFKDFRAYKRREINEFVKEHVDQMETWHKDAKIPALTELIQTVKASHDSCERWQDKLLSFCPKWAVVSACVGVLIIYADWIDAVGWACLIVILPFPVYWGFSTLSYRSCRNTCHEKSKEFKTLAKFIPDVNDLVKGLIDNGSSKAETVSAKK